MTVAANTPTRSCAASLRKTKDLKTVQLLPRFLALRRLNLWQGCMWLTASKIGLGLRETAVLRDALRLPCRRVRRHERAASLHARTLRYQTRDVSLCSIEGLVGLQQSLVQFADGRFRIGLLSNALALSQMRNGRVASKIVPGSLHEWLLRAIGGVKLPLLATSRRGISNSCS